jgi:hypothetical protein
VKQESDAEESEPITRARIRKRRKGRDQCTAHRSDGQACEATALPGALVCLKHGGSAKQVRIKAGRTVRRERLFLAQLELEKHERGTERWYQAMDRVNAAEHALEQYESDLDLLALMKAELADPGPPETRAALLAIARARLDGRPWTSPLRR